MNLIWNHLIFCFLNILSFLLCWNIYWFLKKISILRILRKKTLLSNQNVCKIILYVNIDVFSLMKKLQYCNIWYALESLQSTFTSFVLYWFRASFLVFIMATGGLLVKRRMNLLWSSLCAHNKKIFNILNRKLNVKWR